MHRLRHALPVLLPCALAALDVEPAKLATGDAPPVDPGAVEIAIAGGFLQAKQAWDDAGVRDDRGGRYRQIDATAGVTVGLITDLDAGITGGYTRIDDHALADEGTEHGHGITDLTLAAKWRFLGRDGLEVTAQPALTIPTSGHLPEDSIPTASDHWALGGMVIATWTLEPVVINLDLGGLRHLRKDDDQPHSEWMADAAIGWQVTAWCQPEIELNYARLHTASEDLPDSQVWAVTGGALFPTAWGRFAIGVQQAVAGRNTDRTTAVLGHWVQTF